MTKTHKLPTTADWLHFVRSVTGTLPVQFTFKGKVWFYNAARFSATKHVHLSYTK